MNEAPRKMRYYYLRAPRIYASDLVFNSLHQVETVFSRCFAPAMKLAEARGQTIKFCPFKTIHLHHLPIPHLSTGSGTDGRRGTSKRRGLFDDTGSLLAHP
jgi:hypothetical protein